MPPSQINRLHVGILPFAMFATSALAQAPDAGALQQQIDRERQLQLPQRMAPEKPAAPAEMPPTGVSVTVREFRFAGNTLIPSERLAAVVAGYLNRPLSFAELQVAATAIANAYREAGWVVRAYLPRQDVTAGVITIQIIEAVFGGVRIEGAEPTRLTRAAVQARFTAQQKTGEPLNAEALDRALLIADDLQGVTLAGSLAEGKLAGETELVLKLSDEPLFIGEVGLDNTGARSTGEDRLTANLSVASPLGLGDQLSANFIHTQGSDYLRAAYSLPVGADGWRIGINTSRLDYRLVTPEFATLKSEGGSTSHGLDANYPIVRSRQKNLYVNLALDNKAFDNRSATGTTSHYRINSLTAGLIGNLFDSLGGGGANSASLMLTHGDVSLGTLDASENAALEGRFSKLRYNLTRQQVLTPDLSLYAAYSGQWSDDNLDSAEKFYLGGAHGVRAYPNSEAGGAKGAMLNLELRRKLPRGLTTTAFYDWWRVTQNIDNAQLGANPNTYSLKGYGLSLAWQTNFGPSFKATWARRDGKNPNPTATGNDQDGSLDKNRWWLTASLPF